MEGERGCFLDSGAEATVADCQTSPCQVQC